MAQTPATRYQSDDNQIDYTPGSAVTAGDVILVGTVVAIATSDIASGVLGSLAIEGVFKLPKITGAIAAGDPVYWDPVGSPVTGTASSGAASNTPGVNYLAGYAAVAAASGDSYVATVLQPSKAGAAALGAYSTVAATGSTQADAAQVATGFVVVTAADGTKGVLLPVAAAGRSVVIKNNSASVLKVWPAGSGIINGLSASAAMSIAANTCPEFRASSATQWYTNPLLPS